MDTMINEKDLISMKLLHYLITKKNYSPIIVQGVENEIWLENLDEEYKVIRIVNNYIHNDEQLDFDIFKTIRMVKKIKRKTFSFKMKALNILTDVGDSANLERKLDNVMIVSIKNEKDLITNEFLNKIYPDLRNNLQYSEEGFQLFLKITTEINEKNKREAVENDKVFEEKKIVINYVLLGIIILIFLIGMLFGYHDYFISVFGLDKTLIRNGQIYRLLTGTFLHVNILHLASNCYSLYIIGNQIEKFYGKKKFLAIYVFSALCGSLLAIAMNMNVAIGASGAIFGLLGSLLYFGYYYRVYLGSVILQQTIPVILINLIVSYGLNSINDFANIGGLIGGVLISMALGISNSHKTKRRDQINGIILTSIFAVFLIIIAFVIR